MQLPKALPDESLFSRMCRHFAMTGLTKNQYLKRLVGDERAAVHPYLTSNLFLISKSTHETPRELWLYQTLLPLFSYYLPKYKSIIENYSANSNQFLRACQLSTFREGNVLGAKYCPSCAFVDIQHHGVAYWHCAHQIPGAEACSKHGVWLVHSELPNRVHIADNFLPFYTVQQRESNSLAIEFAKYVERKIQSIRCNDIALNVSGGYRSRLRDKGLLTKSGRVRRQVLARDQYELAKKILPLSSHLFPRSLDDFGYFSSLLAGTFNQHPFKHLLLDFYLSRLQIDNTLMRVLATPQVSGLEGRCCDLLREGLSMAQVSRDIGKSRCYVKAVALRNDIPVNLKPKKITSALMLEVIKMAYKGFHRCAIARKFGISSGSVELIISTTNGLVAWRKRCKADSLCRRYMCQILRFINSNPNACRQQIRNQCEAAFYWLYHHCPEWLEATLPPPQKVCHVDKVNWEERDRKLSYQVSEILSSVDSSISRSELDRMLGSHGWLTSKKHKLPKTMNVLCRYGLLNMH